MTPGPRSHRAHTPVQESGPMSYGAPRGWAWPCTPAEPEDGCRDCSLPDAQEVVCVFHTAQLQTAHSRDVSTGAQNTVATQTLSTTRRRRRHSHSTAINIISSSRSHSDLLCKAGAQERYFPQPLFLFKGPTLSVSSEPSKNLKKQTSG